MNKIIITTGDPNGIGAEITIKALNFLNLPSQDVLLISNKKILDFYGGINQDYELIEIPLKNSYFIIKNKENKQVCVSWLKLDHLYLQNQSINFNH